MEEQHYEYRTGRTQPRKSSNGLIAALLICIIFLCGVISALGLMNIRLTKLLANGRQEGPPLSFSQGDAILPTNAPHAELLGMALQELPGVYQQLYDLPQGLYISQVEENSPAGQLDILPGDVLIAIGSSSLTTLDQLNGLKTLYEPGDQIELHIIREGKELEIRTLFS